MEVVIVCLVAWQLLNWWAINKLFKNQIKLAEMNEEILKLISERNGNS